MHLSASSLPRFGLVLVTAVSLGLGGCASDRDDLSPEQLASRLKETPKPTMQAEQEFFEGKVVVEASLGRGFRSRRRYNDDRDRGGNSMAAYVYEFSSPEEEEDKRYVFNPRVKESPLPPVALRLRLTNTTDAPLEIEFVECNSQLGNFAVQPRTLTLEPKQPGQPDPMISLLGVTAPELPVTLALKIAGQAEKKVLTLKPVQVPPAAEGAGKAGG